MHGGPPLLLLLLLTSNLPPSQTSGLSFRWRPSGSGGLIPEESQRVHSLGQAALPNIGLNGGGASRPAGPIGKGGTVKEQK